jgi:hypothetical protein
MAQEVGTGRSASALHWKAYSTNQLVGRCLCLIADGEFWTGYYSQNAGVGVATLPRFG